MSGDVLTSDVADELLIPVGLPIEHKTGFQPLFADAETLGTKKQPKFERHVEARQTTGVQLRPGYVMDAPAAVANEAGDLLDADVAAVVNLLSAPRDRGNG